MTLTITKPTVGLSYGTWGTTVNDALDAIVAEVNANAATSAAAEADLISDVLALQAADTALDGRLDTATGYDVRQAGAVVNGVTDDWPMVKPVLAAGGTVFLPPGTHYWKLTSSTLSVPAGTRIVGVPGQTILLLDSDTPATDRTFLTPAGGDVEISGCTLRRASAVGIVCFTPGPYTGFTVRDCDFDGKSSVYGIVRGFHPVQLGTQVGTSARLRFDNTTFRDCYFGLFQTNAATGQTTDVRFDNCRFSGNYGDDLEFNGPLGAISNVRVTNCTFESNAASTTGIGFAVGAATVKDLLIRGCRVKGYYNEAFHIEDYCQGVRILDNYVANASTGATAWVVILSGASDIKIEGNTFRMESGTGTGAVISALQGGSGTTPSGGTYAPPSDLRIRRNTILCQDTMQGLYLDTVSRVDVRHNRISSTGTVSGGYSGPATSAIIASGAATSVAITDNEISGFKFGLLPQSGSTVNLGNGFRLGDNVFRDCKFAVGAVNVGDGTISGNDFRNCESSLIASWDAAVQGSVHITDNHATGCTNAMGIYGTCLVVASAARTTGSPVTGSVYNLTNTLPSGTVIRWAGGGVMTLTTTAGVDTTSVTGNLVTAAVANGEQGVAYIPWSSSASKAATVRGNSDDKYGVAGYGAKSVAVGASYRLFGHEDLVVGYVAGITLRLQPAAHCPGRVHTFSNTSGGALTVQPDVGAILGGASYSLAAGAVVRVQSDGGTNWLAC